MSTTGQSSTLISSRASLMADSFHVLEDPEFVKFAHHFKTSFNAAKAGLRRPPRSMSTLNVTARPADKCLSVHARSSAGGRRNGRKPRFALNVQFGSSAVVLRVSTSPAGSGPSSGRSRRRCRATSPHVRPCRRFHRRQMSSPFRQPLRPRPVPYRRRP